MRREPPPGHVFVGSLAEIDPRKVAEVVRRSRHKKTTPLRPIFPSLSVLYCLKVDIAQDCSPPTVCGKKVSPKVFCDFLRNRSEFLHEISHTYYPFMIT